MQTRSLYCGALQHSYVAAGRIGYANTGNAYIWDYAGAAAVLDGLGYHYDLVMGEGYHANLTSHASPRGQPLVSMP